MAVHAFVGGRILTMDPAHPDPEVVIVDGDRIVAVGERALLGAHADAVLVDLAGATLAPGLIDAHNHLSVRALHPRWRDVRAVRDVDELVEAVRTQAAEEPDAEWIRLIGWDESRHGVAPTAADLDAAGDDRPVCLAHTTLHQAVVSSAGLDALGIGLDTPDPAGGEIGRGASGAPDGRLFERAWSAAHARSLAAYADPDRWAEHIARRARELLAEGITCVHDAACSPEAEVVFRSIAHAGTLPISVVAMPHSAELLSNDAGARLDGPPTGEGDAWCRVGAVKLFADGGVAIALDTTIHGAPVRFGYTMDDLGARAADALARGFGVAIHAIGNVGVDRAIDVFESAPDGRLLRLEHAGVTGAPQWDRLGARGAVAVVQPGFVEHVGIQSGGIGFDDHHWLAFAGLAEAGVTLAGSSDDPCAPSSPLWGAWLGASRTTSTGIVFDADQAVPFDDWLAAYTIGAARAGGPVHERERGSLAPGKRADLVVIDERAQPVPAVVQTWVAGKRVV